METGTIVSLRVDRGFGFIHTNGRDVFFHAYDLTSGLTFDELLMERRVTFNVTTTSKGERATEVRAAE